MLIHVKVVKSGPDEERVINDIFRWYNKLARPVRLNNEPVQLTFGASLCSIVGVDEKNEMLHTNMWLNYQWFDYKMKWNVTEYGGVKSIRLPSSMIWTPDILMYNSADEDIDSKFPTNVVIDNTGSMSWIPLGLFISSCPLDIKWFPFDDQLCIMKFGSWTYDASKINMSTASDEMDMSYYTTSGEWDLIANPAKRNSIRYDCCPEEYVDVTFTIHIRRRTLYYIFNLIIPSALISSLTILTFLLPPDAGEKISLGITILLSLTVFLTVVAESVPPTSISVPIIGIYFASIMILCTISVITTVLVLNFHHRNPDTHEMPMWIRQLVCEWLAWALRMSRPGKELSRQFLLRKAKMRELEAKNPPSVSLISNVKDVDNAIPVNDFPSVRSVRLYDDVNIINVRNELLAILNEIRFITHKIKEDNSASDDTNDWKFASMVIDRLCFWLFSVLLVVITLCIYLSVPHIL